MARLLPRVDPESISNPGERAVAKALVEQLPPTVVVYHSYLWLRRAKHERSGVEYLQPGETDFIIVDPERGILLLEVKGGPVQYDPESHIWTRRGKKITDPFEQVEKNKWGLVDQLKEHRVFAGESLPLTIGHAVVFPESRVEGRLPANVDPTILLGADSLRKMQKSVERALDSWCRVRRPKPLGKTEHDALVEVLSPVLHFVPVAWMKVEDQERHLKRLTAEQERLLQYLQNQERAAIEGVAGSGKTLLALSQAQRFADGGKRTLFVCYNKPLADWIRESLAADYTDRIEVSTYHGLCAEVCRSAGIRFAPPKDEPEFWAYEAPGLLEEAAGAVASKIGFEAIVVDEGQDFRDLWWDSLEALYQGPAGALYVFYDPKQCIYQERALLPESLGKPFVLSMNCRNTRKIASLCGEVLDFEPEVHPEAPDGDAPGRAVRTSLQDVIKHTKSVVQNWSLPERGGLKPSQVAILTPWNNHKKWPAAFGNARLVRDFDEWRDGRGILLATHRRFKGLEADALVLAGVPEPGTSKYYSAADHYVACSRGKHLLEVVSLSE